MDKNVRAVWGKPSAAQLAQVLAAISDADSMQRFLRDVMTEKEITEISARLTAAWMLKQGATYMDIVEATKLSSRTVARISAWLQNGCKGYDIAIEILQKKPATRK